MLTLQTRIFVPSSEPTEAWTETLVGRIICPLVNEFKKDLAWFWFARYVWLVGVSPEDKTHCDFDAIPKKAKLKPKGFSRSCVRSIRFRFSISNGKRSIFEARLRKLLKRHGAFISDVRDYDWLSDLGGDRFVGDLHRFPERRLQRCKLVTAYLQIVSQIFMDSLVGPDSNNRFSLEHNASPQNPNCSTFESIHHMLCNILQPPLQAHIFQHSKTKRVLAGSNYSVPDKDLRLVAKLAIQF